MHDLLLLLVSSDPAASLCLAEVSRELRQLRIRMSDSEQDFWASLPKTVSSLLGGVLVLAWGMPADFVSRLKSDVTAHSLPVVACVPAAAESEVDALYEAGATCVVKLDSDHTTNLQRLRTCLEFWSSSATLPRSVRAARI